MRTDQTIFKRYTVTAGVTSYAVPFPLYETSDVAVWLSTDGGSTETQLTLGTQYSVTIASDNKSGTVVLVSGVASAGNILALMSNVPYTQELDLNGVSTINTDATETQLDRDCQQRQQMANGVDRSVKVPITSTKTSAQFMQEFVDDMDAKLAEAAASAASAQSAAETATANATALINDAVRNANDATSEIRTAFSNIKADIVQIPEGNISQYYAKDTSTSTTRTLADWFDQLHVWDSGINGQGSNKPSGAIIGSLNGITEYKMDDSYSVGSSNFRNATSRIHDCVAIGSGVMSEANPGNHNIGIGQFALHNCTGERNKYGDRNVALGSLALFGATTLRRSVAVGRDAGQAFVSGYDNVIVGYRACAGSAPITLDGAIRNDFEVTWAARNTVVGGDALPLVSGNTYWNTIVGGGSLHELKHSTSNTVIGAYSLRMIGHECSYNDKKLLYAQNSSEYSLSEGVVTVKYLPNISVGQTVTMQFTSGILYDMSDEPIDVTVLSVDTTTSSFTFDDPFKTGAEDSGNCVVILASSDGTYIANGGVITVTLSGHSASVGCYVDIYFLDGVLTTNTTTIQTLYVTSVSGDSFVLTPSYSLSLEGSGNCRVQAYELNEDFTGNSYRITSIGANIGANIISADDAIIIGAGNANGSSSGLKINDSIAIGTSLGYATSCVNNVSVGYGAFYNLTSVDGSVAIGYQAGYNQEVSDGDVYIGWKAGYAVTGNAKRNVALGSSAMMYNGATSTFTYLQDTCLGWNSRVTGQKQVQLGDSTSTTYAYGAVQDRSDARDKADVRDTILGSDFILSLRPVDFKWDMRDDYIEIVDDGEDENGNPKSHVEKHEKDGSKKRNRFHHGFIAQEVKAIMDAQGIDFGGYQDHSVNGGCDVLTIGYEELIAPMVKTIQELNARITKLEGAA